MRFIPIFRGIKVHEGAQGPSKALEARFTCHTCKKTATVRIPWGATALKRSTLMKAAVDEHRFLCTVGLPEDSRIYDINYPRE